MTTGPPSRLTTLVDLARQNATHSRTFNFGPIPTRLHGSSNEQLARFGDPLVASLASSWAPLEIIVSTSVDIPSTLIPDPIRPQDGHMAVAYEDGVTALSTGGDGALWILDEQQATAVLWVDDEASLAPWEFTRPLRIAAGWWSSIQGAAMVHAGVVASDDRGVLLVGDSGAGKSTTTMACHGSGLDVLGDDYCIVEPPSDLTLAVAHAMYERATLDEFSLELLPGQREHVVGTAWGGKKLIDLTIAEHPVRQIVAICHVVQDRTGPTHALPMSRAQTLRAGARSTLFQQRLWGRETWNVLAATVRAARCYQLNVADIDSVPDVVRSILDGATLRGAGV